MLLRRIRAFLHPGDTDSEVLAGILERLTNLESRELAHDVAWSEAKEQISRHLKRVREVERRSGGRGEGSDLAQLVLDQKFKRNGG